MNAFEKMLRDTFGYTEAWQLGIVKQLEEILGPADTVKTEKLFDAMYNKRNVVAIYGKANASMIEMVIDMGRAQTFTYVKQLGFTAVAQILVNAAKLIKEQA
jgi:hypothetical protein